MKRFLCKRYKYKTFNKLGMETLSNFGFSKDYAGGLIEIVASYKEL